MIKRIIRKINKALLDLGHKEGSGKFVIISTARTGSNLLVSLLNSHPKISCHGEVFKVYTNKEALQSNWDAIFRNTKTKKQCVGFKLFYEHPLNSSNKFIWDLIENDHSIKIIHLKRNNLLKSYTSLQIAYKSDVWAKKNDNQNILLEDKRVHINITECFNYFKETEKSIQNVKKKFVKHNYTEITYEDFILDKQNQMDKLFKWLNLPSFKVSSNLKKQNKEPLKDLIINYKELAIALNKAGYSNFYLDG